MVYKGSLQANFNNLNNHCLSLVSTFLLAFSLVSSKALFDSSRILKVNQINWLIALIVQIALIEEIALIEQIALIQQIKNLIQFNSQKNI